MISRWWRNHCNQYDVISMIISLISALGKQQKRVLFSFVPLVVWPRLRPNEQSVGQRYSSVATWWTACSELKRSHRKGEVDPCNYCLKSNKQQGTHVSKYYRGGYQPGKDKYMKKKKAPTSARNVKRRTEIVQEGFTEDGTKQLWGENSKSSGRGHSIQEKYIKAEKTDCMGHTEAKASIMISKHGITEKGALNREPWSPSSRHLIFFQRQLWAHSPSEIKTDVKQGPRKTAHPLHSLGNGLRTGEWQESGDSSPRERAFGLDKRYCCGITRYFIEEEITMYWETPCLTEKEDLPEG